MRSLGAAPGASFAQATTDLANQVQLVIAAGDAYLTANPPEYDAAISAYQAAGQAGATSVGPEIDAVGPAALTQPSTQLAWQNNGVLQAIPAANATATSATTAQNLAKTNLTLYQQAIAAGIGSDTKTGPGLNDFVGWAIAAGAVVGVVWALSPRGARTRRRGRRG